MAGQDVGLSRRVDRRHLLKVARGGSVVACRRIEEKTTSAAMLKIRDPDATCPPRINSENAIVATPFGPNQPMNTFVAQSRRVPARATEIASGRASGNVAPTTAAAAQPSLNKMARSRLAPRACGWLERRPTRTPS